MTTARYDGLAEWYDEHLADFAARGTAVLADVLGSGQGRCLEVGCGGGWQLSALAAAGWKVVGVDISSDQLRVAQRRLTERARLVLADAGRLPFPSGTFDTVVSAFTHTDLDDWGAAVAECVRVLRSGGRLAYVGTHPCFVGPFSHYPGDEAPVLYPGYRQNGWTIDARDGKRPTATGRCSPCSPGYTAQRVYRRGFEPRARGGAWTRGFPKDARRDRTTLRPPRFSARYEK